MGNNSDSGHDIVERIDEILKRKNLKRQAIADFLGISTQSFTHWSKRGNVPAADIIFKMADFLGVSAEYLVKGKIESGIPQNVLDMAYEIAELDQNDQREIQLLLNLKKEKYLRTGLEKDSDAG